MSDRREAWYSYVELTHRYADAVDRGAGSEVARLFAADGRWDGTDYGLDLLTGSDALARHFAGSGDQPTSVHLVHNHLVVDRTASQVTARSYAHALLPRGDRVRHVIVGYHDVLTLEGEEWRFDERVLKRGLSY